MKPSEGRFESIDCLRGWALIGVLVTHCAFVVPAVGAGFLTLFRTGQFGVDLFFVISGFVLSESAFRRQRQPGWRAQAGFFRRRLYRLIPLYWVGMLLYGYLIEANLGLREEEASLQVWAGNLMLLNGWQPGWENYIVPGGWSIGAEATFAAIFALIYPWIKNLKMAIWWWVGMVVLVAFFTTPLSRMVASFLPQGGDPTSGYLSFRHLPSFFGGIVVWHMHRSGVSGSISTWLRLLVMALVVGLLIGRSFGLGENLERSLMMGSAMMILVLAALNVAPALLGGDLIAWIGRHSYGSYIVHYAMIIPAEVLVVALLPVGASALLMYGLVFALVCAFTFPAAWCLENLLELPRFSRRLCPSLFVKPNRSSRDAS